MEFKTVTHDEFYDNFKFYHNDEAKKLPYSDCRHSFWWNPNPPVVYMVVTTVNEMMPDYWYSENDQGVDYIECETPIAHAEIWHQNGEWHICNIGVRVDRRNSGIGKKLIDAVVEFFVQRNITAVIRTRPTASGAKYTSRHMDAALQKAGISHKLNR